MTAALQEKPEALTYLRGRGLEQDTIQGAELGYVAEGRFADCIAIPYFDARHRWRSTRYRHLRPNAPRKYDAAKGTKGHLYGIEFVNEPVVAITEGEFDSLILRQMGFASVAIAGVHGWDRDWRWLFRNCDLVLVVMDSDTARERPDGEEYQPGQDAQKKVAGAVGLVTDVQPVDLPLGMDVTDLYLTDPDALRELMS